MNEINILYIGTWSQYHGSDYIPGVMVRILSEHENVKFTIQVNMNQNLNIVSVIPTKLSKLL